MTLLKRYYIFFLCINIFLPKLNVGFASFYVFEIVNLFLLGFLLARGKIVSNAIVQTYLLFILLTYVAFVVGVVKFNLVDVSSLARLFKFTFFIFYLIVPFYLLDALSEKDIRKVVKYQLLFFIVAGSYVVFHMITDPLSISEYMWGYDNRYRLIGLTGYAVDLSGNLERLEGTTSVSMGVFISFIFLVYLSYYHHYGRKSDLLVVCLLGMLELLVYSRAGVVSLAIGLIYYFVLNAHPKTMIKTAFVLLILVSGVIYFGVADDILSAGTFSKITNLDVTKDPRYMMLKAGLSYIQEYPFTLLIGSGYGEKYTLMAVGYSHLEGLFPTTILTSGLFAFGILALHFFFLWLFAKMQYLRTHDQYSVFLYAIRLFVPGWFLSAFVAGNTFQTDYYFPVIYFIFVSSYYLSKHTSTHASNKL